MRRLGSFVLELVLGAIGGAACDQIHVRFGVLAYPEPVRGLFGQPWWVPCVFGAATVVILATAEPFARAARPRTPETLVSPYASGAVWFLGAYFLSGLLFRHPELLAAIYGVTFLVRVLPRSDRWPLLLYAVLLAAGGSFFEAWLSSTGSFHYTHTVWLVPSWLPGLYLHGAPLALSVAQGMDLRRAAG